MPPTSDPPRPAEGAAPDVRRALMLFGLFAFCLLGVMQSFYGPLFGAMQTRFAVGVAQVGSVVSAHFLGSTLAVLLASLALPRWGYGRLVVGATALLAIGAAALALAPQWAVVLAAACVAGFGYGMLVVVLNLGFARAFGREAVSALNLLNAVFGVGAVAGPALLALAIGRWGSLAVLGGCFMAVAAAALLLGLFGLRLRARLALPVAKAGERGRAAPLPWLLVGGFSALLLLSVGLEASSGNWAPTHVGLRLPEAQAALGSAAYWLALTAGRFLVAGLGGRWAPGVVVVGGVALAAVGAVIGHLPALALPSYLLLGLGSAPIFPTTIAWVERVFPGRSERVTPLVMTAGNLGPILGVPAVGLAVANWGPTAVPSMLLAMAIGVLCIGLWLRRATLGA